MADVRFEAANIDTTGKKMYELAGDTSDPGGYYYIAVTFSAAGRDGKCDVRRPHRVARCQRTRGLHAERHHVVDEVLPGGQPDQR